MARLPISFQLELMQKDPVMRESFQKLQNFLATAGSDLTPGEVVDLIQSLFPILVYSEMPYGIANLDGTGRLRTSNYNTIFDSAFTFDLQDDLWTATTATGGTITRDANTRFANLNVTTSSGSRVYRRSRRYIPHQIGKSQYYVMSFLFNAAKAGVRQRIGAFDSANGVFLEMNGTTDIAFTMRTNTSGAPSDTNRVTQANWNLDILNGSGYSGKTIDFTKIQQLIIDYSWLGTGVVRCGFLIEDRIVFAHSFKTSNLSALPSMGIGGQPVAAEIENTSATASSSTLGTLAFSAGSEGKFEENGFIRSASAAGVALATINTTLLPLLSIRLKSTALRHSIQLLNYEFYLDTTDTIKWQLIKNATLTGAAFASVGTSSITEFDTAATAIAGGTVLMQGYLSAQNNHDGGALITALTGVIGTAIGSLETGASEILTLAARNQSGNASVGTAITFKEFY